MNVCCWFPSTKLPTTTSVYSMRDVCVYRKGSDKPSIDTLVSTYILTGTKQLLGNFSSMKDHHHDTCREIGNVLPMQKFNVSHDRGVFDMVCGNEHAEYINETKHHKTCHY